MIEPKILFDSLKAWGIGMFTGVPDSLLKNFCAYVDDIGNVEEHFIAANEGNAIALAAGYYLATGKLSVVYMQNSGLGNAINPLISIVDSEVYRIPMLVLIGWRGEPGIKDEPQHVKQGRITPFQLDLLGIPYRILGADSDVGQIMEDIFTALNQTGAPVALLVKKNTFSEYKRRIETVQISSMSREDALRHLLALTGADDLIVSTTGKTSREVFELRIERGEPQRDFLTVGGMGHAASIALGVALGNRQKRVICLDGDGALLMHMGALPVIGDIKPRNLVHVLLNNAAHESVGGQPTVAGKMDFKAVAMACGYRDYQAVSDVDSLGLFWNKLINQPGPVFLEIKIKVGSRSNLGRPTSSPEENKRAFMDAANG